MHRWSQRRPNRIIVAIALLLGAVAQFLPAAAEAGFQQAYVRIDRMAISSPTGGLVCAQPSTANTGMTEGKVAIQFPSTYTLNETAANWTVTTTDLPSGATAWTGINTASSANNTTKIVTFPSGNLASTSTYCFHFAATNTLTTASAAASSQQANITTLTAADATIDYTQIALANINDDTITVTAVVPPSFIIQLEANADPFSGNLTPTGVVATSGIDVTITTNAKGGWIAWAKDSEQGLHSATTNYTIPTVGTLSSGTYANGVPDGSTTTLSNGTEGYVMDVDLTTDAAGGCTLGIAAEYNGTVANAGGSVMGNFQPIASCVAPPSPATANGDVVTLVEKAAISGATPAGSDYSDIITIVAAGNF